MTSENESTTSNLSNKIESKISQPSSSNIINSKSTTISPVIIKSLTSKMNSPSTKHATTSPSLISHSIQINPTSNKVVSDDNEESDSDAENNNDDDDDESDDEMTEKKMKKYLSNWPSNITNIRKYHTMKDNKLLIICHLLNINDTVEIDKITYLLSEFLKNEKQLFKCHKDNYRFNNFEVQKLIVKRYNLHEQIFKILKIPFNNDQALLTSCNAIDSDGVKPGHFKST